MDAGDARLALLAELRLPWNPCPLMSRLSWFSFVGYRELAGMVPVVSTPMPSGNNPSCFSATLVRAFRKPSTSLYQKPLVALVSSVLLWPLTVPKVKVPIAMNRLVIQGLGRRGSP
jgi:hypothetical protein